jgi:hypothetical protein
VFFLLGRYFTRFAVTAGVFAICVLILRRTWYSRLEQHETTAAAGKVPPPVAASDLHF